MLLLETYYEVMLGIPENVPADANRDDPRGTRFIVFIVAFCAPPGNDRDVTLRYSRGQVTLPCSGTAERVAVTDREEAESLMEQFYHNVQQARPPTPAVAVATAAVATRSQWRTPPTQAPPARAAAAVSLARAAASASHAVVTTANALPAVNRGTLGAGNFLFGGLDHRAGSVAFMPRSSSVSLPSPTSLSRTLTDGGRAGPSPHGSLHLGRSVTSPPQWHSPQYSDRIVLYGGPCAAPQRTQAISPAPVRRRRPRPRTLEPRRRCAPRLRSMVPTCSGARRRCGAPRARPPPWPAALPSLAAGRPAIACVAEHSPAEVVGGTTRVVLPCAV